MKPALTKLSEMYKNNLIDRQFAVRTGDDRRRYLQAEKVGRSWITGGEAGLWLTRLS